MEIGAFPGMFGKFGEKLCFGDKFLRVSFMSFYVYKLFAKYVYTNISFSFQL